MQRPPILDSHRRFGEMLHPVLDAAAIMASLAMVKWIAIGFFDQAAILMGMVAVLTFVLMSHVTGLHRRAIMSSPDREFGGIVVAWIATVSVLGLLAFGTRYGIVFSRAIVVTWIVVCPAIIGLQRMCLRIVQAAFARRGFGVRRVAIAGRNELGIRTAKNIVDTPSLAMKMTGFYDDRESLRQLNEIEESTNGLKPQDDETILLDQESELTGGFDDLVSKARCGEVDLVMITLPMRAEARIKWLLDQLSDTTASVYIVPDFFVFELLHSQWTSLGDLPAVSVFENPLFGVDGVVKRIVDIALATAGLVAAAPVMLAVAIAVKVTSRGPVFFRQKRYGLDGREILVWKFRSMKTCDNGPQIRQASKEDPRVTRVGSLLRRTSLDELPQLFNVINGTMSLVGPRPHASAHNEQYRGLIRGYMLRHKVKPGITGLAQVNGCRGETETLDKMEARIEWDHRYIRSWSLWMDIKILFQTVFVVLRRDNAY
ncbi:MAG: undecaprenyl-phosphate glucose phosphotransferase [Planctomycetota bacterium]